MAIYPLDALFSRRRLTWWPQIGIGWYPVEAGIEPFAGYWAAGPEELIPVFETSRINIVVTGGETNGHFSIFQGSPMRMSFRGTREVGPTVSIDAWR